MNVDCSKMMIKASDIRLRYFMRRLPLTILGFYYLIWEIADEQRTIKLISWSIVTWLILIWPLLFRLRLLVDVALTNNGSHLHVQYLDNLLRRREMKIPIEAIRYARMEPATLFVRSNNELILRTGASRWKFAVISDAVYERVSSIDWDEQINRPASLLKKNSGDNAA